MNTVMERTRTNAGRWQAALDRAVAEGLDALELVGVAGAFVVESASRPGVAYLVTGNGAACTCRAGQRGFACKHAAATKAALGEIAPRPPAEPIDDRVYQLTRDRQLAAMRMTADAARQRLAAQAPTA